MNTRHLVLTLFGAVSLALSGCAEDTNNDNPTPSSGTVATGHSPDLRGMYLRWRLLDQPSPDERRVLPVVG